MLNNISKVAATLVASTFFAASAFAQTVLVVDTSKVVNESAAGKSAATQLKGISESMSNELKAIAGPLDSKAKSLSTALEGKKTLAEINQTLKARPDLQQQVADVQSGEQKVQQESKIKQYEYNLTENKALAEIGKEVQTVIDAVAAERGAQLVLDKTDTLYFSDAVDITDTVMARLNSQMPTITVTRTRLPRKPAGTTN